MARIRSIHPQACDGERLAAVSDSAERTFWRLNTHADDDGRGEDHPRLLAAKLFPLNPRKNAGTIDKDLTDLAKAGLLVRYEVAGRRYFEIVEFSRWQHPRHKKDSTLPPPSAADNGHVTAKRGKESAERGQAPAVVGDGVGGGDGEGGGASRTTRSDAATRLPDDWRPSPEPDLVADVGGQSEAALEFEKFCDYWRAKPGKDGRKTDWQATWRNWLRKGIDDRARAGPRRGLPGGITHAEAYLRAADEADRAAEQQRMKGTA